MNIMRNLKPPFKAMFLLILALILISTSVGANQKTASSNSSIGNLQQPLFFLSDGQFVYGPNVKDFSSTNFLLQRTKLSTKEVDNFKGAALRYSINPKVLLTIIESQSEFLSNPSPEAIGSPLGYKNLDGFTPQIEFLSEKLFEAFYWHLYKYQPQKDELLVPEIRFINGERFQVSSETNAATYAILRVLAELSTPEQWQELASKDTVRGFYKTYPTYLTLFS